MSMEDRGSKSLPDIHYIGSLSSLHYLYYVYEDVVASYLHFEKNSFHFTAPVCRRVSLSQ